MIRGKRVLLLILGQLAHLVSAINNHESASAEKNNLRKTNVENQEDQKYWMDLGQNDISSSLKEFSSLNTNVAKNIILFIGDGMSLPTVTAARIFKAQKKSRDFERPEKEYLTFETFPHLGHSKTYDVDHQTSDSASTASAMFSGVKTKSATLGFDSRIDKTNVRSSFRAAEVRNIMNWAQDANKATGIVTTARITHATPAALYAHSYDRNWECDSMFDGGKAGSVPPEGLHDIAWQLVNKEPGNKIRVLLGGGAPAFFRKSDIVKVNAKFNNKTVSWDKCFRSDGQDLAQKWLSDHGKMAKLVMNRDELMGVRAEETDFLLGLMAKDHVQYDDLRTEDDPSLAEMTQKAIEILRKSSDGFFLMVEGGRIDHAHHESKANRALSETVAMDLAVEKALEMMRGSLDETLVIVTADHSHTMSISGYAERGTDITGLSGLTFNDSLPYTTLSYANGPGFNIHNHVSFDKTKVARKDLSLVPTSEVTSFDFVSTSGAPSIGETHGGDDVGIYARGPMAHLFHRTHEQSYIAYVMAYSACLGPYGDDGGRCKGRKSTNSGGVTNSEEVWIKCFRYLMCIVMHYLVKWLL